MKTLSHVEIPTFPALRQLEFSDKAIIDDLLEKEQNETSGLTFANLYLWRRHYGFELAKLHEGIVIRTSPKDEEPFYMPPIGMNDMVSAAHELLDDDKGMSIQRVSERDARMLESAGFSVEHDPDNSDYVYRATDLINLAGRKYHRKRNHITRFDAQYHYEYRHVGRDLVVPCADLQVEWCDIKDCFRPNHANLAEEHEAVMEALSMLDELDLVAGAILIDGKVASFGIGGELNHNTFVVHFEKANPAYPGLYQVINKEFAADAAKDYEFINREQDLGDEGLRKAKESYYPHHMVNKYTVRLP